MFFKTFPYQGIAHVWGPLRTQGRYVAGDRATDSDPAAVIALKQSFAASDTGAVLY
jgi:hypothetical protein